MSTAPAPTTTDSGNDSALPRLVADRARRAPHTVALRAKELGIWQQTTWSQLDEELRVIAHGLADLGIGVGDRVALLADNRPEWLYAELGTSALRAVFVGMHPATTCTAVEQILNDAAVRVLIAQDQEQVDKAVETGCPRLRWIVHLEHRGLRDYTDPRLIPYEELRERGRTHRVAHPDLLDLTEAQQTTDDLAALVFPFESARDDTAATELRGSDIASALGGLRTAIPGRSPDGRDVVLPCLSLCEPAERALTVWAGAAFGVVIHFPESYDTITGDLREVQPTLRLAPAATWQRMVSDIEERTGSASRLKRACYRLALGAIDRVATRQGAYTPISRLLFAVGYVLSGRALRDKLGLRKTRAAFWSITVQGSALPHDIPPDPDTASFFRGLGIPITRTENISRTDPDPAP
ncbi:AMP-binding protein [Nocardia sp. NPDC050710]|uniref:AMP-binding protein n=1 Tax=Nocardia sp. NPDC050710 TaxID=3157220 RepID=UPI0033E3AA21